MFLKDIMGGQGVRLFRWRSYLPLLLVPAVFFGARESGYFEIWVGKKLEIAWDIFAVMISFAGLALRVHVSGHAPRGTSGRNTRKQRADSLNTTGLYSATSNPLYLGNFLVLLGFALALKVWWVMPLTIGSFAFYYERIILAEEKFLHQRFGEMYLTWLERTPAFFPNPKLWERPVLRFCFRSALRREYHGFYLIVVVHTAIEMATDLSGENETIQIFLRDNPGWIYFLLFGTSAYIVLRLFNKFTRLLRVAGR